MISRRHLLPVTFAAAASIGTAELVPKIGMMAGKGFVSCLSAGPAAIFGAVTGIFYSVIYDLLTYRTGIHSLKSHVIAVLGSAGTTFAIAHVTASAGLIAISSLPALGLLIAAAIAADMVYRAIFGGQHPRKLPIELPKRESIKEPAEKSRHCLSLVVPQARMPSFRLPQIQPLPLPQAMVAPAAPLPAPAALASPPLRLVLPAGRSIRPLPAAYQPTRWIWPEKLSEIGIESEMVKQQIEEYLLEVRSEIEAGRIPEFHRKQISFDFKGKSWRLPRTLSFMVDTRTNQVSTILLSVSKDRVAPLGKGRGRTAKVIYNLTTGRKMCKKAVQNSNEVALLQALNGSEGIEPLDYVRTVGSKTQLITPLFKGTLDKLLKSRDLTAEDMKKIMLQLLKGLEKLHQYPEIRTASRTHSYHSDIKPSNILYDKELNVVISDMESVNDLNSFVGTPGWKSPQKRQAWGTFSRQQGITDYNQNHSQGDDNWSMGLIFAAVLKNALDIVLGVAPLRCILGKYHVEQVQDRFLLKYTLNDSGISNITQAEIDQEIADEKVKLGSSANRVAMGQMWDIVREMLSVDPQRRLSARQARERLEAVVLSTKVPPVSKSPVVPRPFIVPRPLVEPWVPFVWNRQWNDVPFQNLKISELKCIK
ncbi:MAG: hypothetical protein LLG04_05775 [Parachlamydia sp.]|nr:hypothetical protein [Parachlamydia sp.]